MACVPLDQSGSGDGNNRKRLVYEDFNYEYEIKTVQLYPNLQVQNNTLQPAVLPLSQESLLVLAFDDLVEEIDNYYAKIIHCNRNWQPSQLNDLEFLDEYNEFPINDYDFSVNTRTPYVHYKLALPRVKLPGNYLLKVYRSNEADVVLTRRFMIFDNAIQINSDQSLSALNSVIRTNQQISFDLSYANSGLDIRNPLQNIAVVIRQNQRWDNAITELKPSFIREGQQVLEYRHFNLENNFPGGNEFRFFDLRSLQHFGQNVDAVRIGPTDVKARILVDLPRTGQAYAQNNDLNGNFIVANADTGDGNLDGDYVDITFTLQTEPTGGQVFVYGALSNWRHQNPMTYDSLFGGYRSVLKLKQGWYDYQYEIRGDSLKSYHYEGSHFGTENQYEIFAYYYDINRRIDLLVGYYAFGVNSRNR